MFTEKLYHSANTISNVISIEHSRIYSCFGNHHTKVHNSSPNDESKTLMKKYFTLLQKLYFTTENFTLLRKTLLYYGKVYYMKSIFSTKLELIKIPFSIRKLVFFFILILIDVLEYE